MTTDVHAQLTTIPPYAKVKVYWNEIPENYSKANKNLIRNKFAKKYGIDKDKIKVVYRPVRIDNKGNIIKMDGVKIDNIGDVTYQRQLFKEWLTRNDKKVNYEHLMRLDDKVNGELNVDIADTVNRKWQFDWIYLDNFQSYGDDNFFPVDKYNGLVMVNSTPSNQGGKTILLIDTLKFLLFGTTSRTQKNEEIFNRYRDKNSVTVRGLLRIEGDEEIVIERILNRREKRSGGWTVTNSLKYYRILPDGEEELMEEKDAVATTKKIRAVVGDVKDFDAVSLATGKNLDEMIDYTVGESGKIFTKLIGLEIMEIKEKAARDMYNTWAKTMKSNIYNKVELEEEIEECNSKLEMTSELLKDAETKLENTVAELDRLDKRKTELLNSKEKVDEKLVLTNPVSLQSNIDIITEGGVKLKEDLAEMTTELTKLGDVDFDEYKEKRTNDKLNGVKTNIGIKKAEIERLRAEIIGLKESEICPSCNRPLDDVDHKDHIKELTDKGVKLSTEVDHLTEEQETLVTELETFKGVKEELDRKQRLELETDRIKLKMEAQRNKLREAMNIKREYDANVKAIEFNKNVDSSLNMANSDIQIQNHQKDETIKTIQRIKDEIDTLKATVEKNEGIVTEINKEAEIEKIYKVYIDMVGKKGVSKIVLRSVLPIINAELERLLEGVCDFDVEVAMDDKNDVRLLIVKHGIEGPLRTTSGFERTASGVALRTVLGVVSTLPMPNFIAFDEVLDKVAPENVPRMKPLFEKIKDMYDKVFVITHDDLAKDWSEQIITINKVNDASKLVAK